MTCDLIGEPGIEAPVARTNQVIPNIENLAEVLPITDLAIAELRAQNVISKTARGGAIQVVVLVETVIETVIDLAGKAIAPKMHHLPGVSI